MLSFLKGSQQSVKSNQVTSLLVSGFVATPCVGESGFRVIFASRIRNLIKSRLYNQKPWALEFGIQLMEFRIQKPSSNDKESGIQWVQNPRRGIQNLRLVWVLFLGAIGWSTNCKVRTPFQLTQNSTIWKHCIRRNHFNSYTKGSLVISIRILSGQKLWKVRTLTARMHKAN